jgi:poly-gamma-glutamate synthesis protein (capsule biosynthesis protein)
LGANSFGPPFAWATDNGPGSAEFDINIMSATIRNIKERDLADVVFAELQYQESYDVQPLFDQRQTFRALTFAGADVVTGVQSHVPQAIEFLNGRLILHGLGNLFFDQMWQQATREGMIVKHTLYQGRHLSTQVRTTLIYDFGQPHWTTAEERESILRRVFGASYWE